MDTPAIPSSTRPRWIRRGLCFCVSLVAAFILYVASIGPLALLESRGIGSESTWHTLHETVYYPIFRTWQRGPRWVSSSLRWYVSLFVAESGNALARRSFAGDSNHWERWYYFFQQAGERRTLKNPDFGRSGIGAEDAKQMKREVDELL